MSLMNFIDRFSIPITLKFKRKSHLSSSFGGIISIGVIAIFIAMIIYIFINFQNKNTNTITSIINVIDPPPSVNFNSDFSNFNSISRNSPFFLWSFKFWDQINNKALTKEEIDRLFYVQTITNIYRNQGQQREKSAEMTYESCDSIQKDLTNKFPFLIGALCPKVGQLDVAGQFINTVYKFISMRIYTCDNGPNKSNCASSAEVQKTLLSTKVMFYYTNFELDPQLNGNIMPIKPSIETITAIFSQTVKQSFDVYLSLNSFTSYENIYIPWLNPIKFTLVKVSKVVQLPQMYKSDFIAFFLRSDSNTFEYNRTYQSFIEVLSIFGGMWKVLFFLGAILATPINKKLLLTRLANAIYNMISPLKQKLIKTENFEKYSNDNNPYKEPNKLIKMNNKTSLEAEMTIDYYKYERLKGMPYSIKQVLFSMFCFCFKKPKNIQKEEEIFKESEIGLKGLISTQNIFKFSKQMKALKQILLGKHKKILLSYSHKYCIYDRKLPLIKEGIKQWNYVKSLNNVESSLMMETDFVEGIRALRNKLVIDSNVDINLIERIKMKNELKRKYFINYGSMVKDNEEEEGEENGNGKKKNVNVGNRKKKKLNGDNVRKIGVNKTMRRGNHLTEEEKPLGIVMTDENINRGVNNKETDGNVEIEMKQIGETENDKKDI